jgi:hypothetical protein
MIFRFIFFIFIVVNICNLSTIVLCSNVRNNKITIITSNEKGSNNQYRKNLYIDNFKGIEIQADDISQNSKEIIAIGYVRLNKDSTLIIIADRIVINKSSYSVHVYDDRNLGVKIIYLSKEIRDILYESISKIKKNLGIKKGFTPLVCITEEYKKNGNDRIILDFVEKILLFEKIKQLKLTNLDSNIKLEFNDFNGNVLDLIKDNGNIIKNVVVYYNNNIYMNVARKEEFNICSTVSRIELRCSYLYSVPFHGKDFFGYDGIFVVDGIKLFDLPYKYVYNTVFDKK